MEPYIDSRYVLLISISLHDNIKGLIIQNEEIDGSQKFSTEKQNLEQDKMVELQKSHIEDTHRLLMGMGMDEEKVESLNEWWQDEEYDSDAFLDDLEENEDHSNLFQFLTKMKQDQYYNPIYDSARKGEEDEHKELLSLNFGMISNPL